MARNYKYLAMNNCIKEIISLCSLKSLLLNSDCVKENKLYHIVLSNAVEPLFSDELLTKESKTCLKNLTKIGLLYDTVYCRLHTGQWNEVEQTEREMFTILSYIRILYALIICEASEESIKDGIYLADLGLMLGATVTTRHNNVETDLLSTTATILTEQLSKTSITQPPLKRIKLDKHIHEEGSNDINTLPVLESPSLECFGMHYYDKQQPALFKGIIDDWPAMERWHDPNYLLSVAGERTVPIELGSQYSSDDWSQKLMKFREFVEQNICDNPGTSATIGHPAAYLAQHDLFDQIPALRRDIVVPDYIGRTDISPRIKAWLGPEGTISPLHTDPCHNLLCQVFGAKTVILARPEDTDKLYPHDHFVLHNTSQVDARRPDYEKFPLMREVSFHRVTLRRGDVLYIPPKWWHYVESLSPSFSVSFWFE
ncbi:bifunctional peptidase and arginyl-hydroxylase JMJD5 [Anopheles nili]|uniref:bifunctional peptidase and arginyl-hydroxylase JMJD5 n=1 Tax=Anopheles nili TaxID=185578 RepID=UPI00237A2E94|nr:bifunctional peptidase and arginyl-hydroxylase JMJD5 [Anopheles nili]